MIVRLCPLVLIAAPLACAEPAVWSCDGDDAVQLFAHGRSRSHLTVSHVGDVAYYRLNEDALAATMYVGRGCRAPATMVSRGLAFTAVRLHPDPADDDPAVVCSGDGRFLRLDLEGGGPPTLLLPQYDCRVNLTSHGAVVSTHYLGGGARASWLFPDFPDEAGAVHLIDEAVSYQAGDVLIVRADRALHRLDVLTGDTELLVGSAESDVAVSETHLLWREDVDDPEAPAPMRLLDLATGARAQPGWWDPAIDDHRDEDERSWPGRWQFSADGRHVIHVPAAASAAVEAFDLAGRPVAYAVPGDPLLLLADGAAISVTADFQAHYSALGADVAVPLDYHRDPETVPSQRPVVRGDRLEHVLAGDLVGVPLDGGPAAVLARGVGLQRDWLDDERLLTVVDGELVTIHAPSGARRVHASEVYNYAPSDRLTEDGAHYRVDAGPDDPRSGVWHLPAARLLAAE